jgi:hypothetical protein
MNIVEVGNFLTMMFFILMGGYWLLDTTRRRRRAIYLEAYVFPATVKKGIHKQYPFLSDDQLTLVLQGLRQYFQLRNYSRDENNKMLAMPSRVVDVAWHEFILTTRLYEEFCKNSNGKYIHHTPAAVVKNQQVAIDGLKQTWRATCKWEGIDQKVPSRLPFLFAIDAALEIPDGFKHSLDNDYATKEIPMDSCCG